MALSGFPELLPAQRFVENDRPRPAATAPSSCTVSRRSRPRPSNRWTSCCARARSTRRSTCCAGCTPTPRPVTAGLGLHFDLTVPFARYVLEHAGHLEFPFRRYQIQKVWRGERPQEGRFREFTQADIDVVARDTLPFHHDVEIARVMAEALGALDFLPAAAPAGQQPPAHRGLLPRARRPGPRGGDAGDRQARQGAGRRDRRAAAAARPGWTSGRPGCACSWPRSAPVTPPSSRGCASSASSTSCSTPVSTSSPRSISRLRGDHRGHGRGRPAHRPRPGLLHRHGVRDPDGRLRGAGLDLLGRAVRLAGLGRADHLSRCRHLARRHPAAGAAAAARRAERVAGGAVGRARRAARRGLAAGQRRRSRRPCAAAASPPRSRPRRRSTASRSATPNGAASRSCGSRASRTRSRTSAAGSRWPPIRRPGARRKQTCTRR